MASSVGNKFTDTYCSIFGKLCQIDLDAEGKLYIVLERKSKSIEPIKRIRETFLYREVAITFDVFGR